MHRDEFRQVVLESVRQSLGQGNAAISALSEEQLTTLIQAIADGVFAGLETALDEATDVSAAAAAAAATAARQVAVAAEAQPAPEVPSGLSVASSISAGAAAAAAKVPSSSTREEVLIWRGRPYLTIGTIYELTTQRLRIIRGIVSNIIEEVELVRVRDTAVKQNVGERMFDIGDITVLSSDATSPSKTLYNVRNPVEVREMLRKAVYEERERRKLLYREEMHDEADMDHEPHI